MIYIWLNKVPELQILIALLSSLCDKVEAKLWIAIVVLCVSSISPNLDTHL